FYKQTPYFPTALQTASPPEEVSSQAANPLEERPSVDVVSYEELASKIRSRIWESLMPPDMQAFRDALASQMPGVAAEDVLIPPQPADLIEALDRVHTATQMCVQQWTTQHPDRVDRLKNVAKTIFGWLVTLAVNHEQVHKAGHAFNPWEGGV